MIFPLALSIALSVSPAQERKSSLTGDIRKHEQVKSQHLPTPHDILVYLPPGYKGGTARYPVFYLGDGQNVFDGMTSFIPNKEWRMDESAESLIKAGLIEPVILVAISNGLGERANEYLPTRAKFRDSEMGGQGDAFVKMLTAEIKPFIDKTYRTKTGRTDTAIGGSSLGGIMALHTALSRPDVFGKAAVVSPSVWWDDRLMVKRVDQLRARPKVKIWLDMGTDEGHEAVSDATLLSNALERKGWKLGADLAFYIDHGAQHNEDAWARRGAMMLTFLFGRQLVKPS